MKYSSLKIFVLTTLFSTINIISLFAKRRPPNPFDNNDGFPDSDVVGSQAPIDDFIPLLFVGAILLGIWAINKYKVQNT